MSTRLAALALAAGLAACAASVPAEDEIFEARLSGAQEVPAVATAASGEAQLRFNPKAQLLHWKVSHAGSAARSRAGTSMVPPARTGTRRRSSSSPAA